MQYTKINRTPSGGLHPTSELVQQHGLLSADIGVESVKKTVVDSSEKRTVVKSVELRHL
jgi:hypothetical protein